MSYDIDNWKTKRLDKLMIPLAAFFEHARDDWHPEVIREAEGNGVLLQCGCEQEIKGTLADGFLAVSEFEISGEGSGTFYRWILKPALKQSSGLLEAVLVWEGGDAIQRLKVKDGNVSTEDVDL